MTRIQGAGTIEKRGKNVWRIRFNLGQDPITGRYRYAPWRTVHGTKAQAQAALAQYRNELENGIKVDADKVTFGEYAKTFCDRRKADATLSKSTISLDGIQVRALNKHITDIPLRDIDSTTIKNLMAKLSETKTPSGLKRAYRKLYQIMREAVEDDLILRNPCDKVKAPKVPRAETRFLDRPEVLRLMAALDDIEQEAALLEQTHRATKPRKEHRYEQSKASAMLLRSHALTVRIALASGCRRGEVLGLLWGNVDLDAHTIKISQQHTAHGTKAPKTPESKRTITLDSETMAALQQWKTMQAEFLLSLGIAQNKETPVITNETGGLHEPNGFSRWWRAFCMEHSFEGLRFHDLRHTHATLLIGNNVDIKTVQGRLGHTLASTTLDVYASVMPAKDKEAANIVGKILTAPKPVKGEVINL